MSKKPERKPTDAELAELQPLFEAALAEMTSEAKGRIVPVGTDALAYQENGWLYLEWPDGLVLRKPLSRIRS
jgi:hypothetical protein